MIPTLAPEWTNYNPSDPGITLIELFAYLSEMLLYRQNRVTDANLHMFLKLLNGPDWVPTQNLHEDVRRAVLQVRERYRAVTCADFEALVIAAHPQIARARCLPRRNLVSENPLARATERPGHVSVIIIPDSDVRNPQPSPTLLQAVKDYLEPRRLLTTRVNVVGPRYLTVGVRLTLFLKGDATADQVLPKAIDALKTFLHPLTGGPDKTGWSFGRDVYISEIYELLDKLPGVNYVQKTNGQDELIVSNTERLIRNDLNGELIAVQLQPDALVDAQIDENEITPQIPNYPIGTLTISD